MLITDEFGQKADIRAGHLIVTNSAADICAVEQNVYFGLPFMVHSLPQVDDTSCNSWAAPLGLPSFFSRVEQHVYFGLSFIVRLILIGGR